MTVSPSNSSQSLQLSTVPHYLELFNIRSFLSLPPQPRHSYPNEADACRLIIHLADTIADMTSQQSNLAQLQQERLEFVRKNLWSAGLGTTSDDSPVQISRTLRHYYQTKLSMLTDD